MKKKTIQNINVILAKWNPIGVDDHIADEEYKGYIPLILKFIEDRDKLEKCLEDILINKMGVGYNSNNKEHFDDMQQVCDNLIRAYKQ